MHILKKKRKNSAFNDVLTHVDLESMKIKKKCKCYGSNWGGAKYARLVEEGFFTNM